MIRALVLDFDGLIVDTERPLYEAWRKVFTQRGHDLPVDLWIDNMGQNATANNYFDRLADLLGEPVDEDAIRAEKEAEAALTLDAAPAMPGVVDLIESAESRGLTLAVASSSSFEWVGGHLRRLRLLDRFAATVTRLDTTNHKPHPAPYTLAVERLGVDPDEAIAFEDTPAGVRSAKAAGLTAVAVPSEMTAHLDFPEADARCDSLADVVLSDWLD